MIYLDYMATTPVDPRVVDAMNECLLPGGVFGNASSISHQYGAAARDKIALATHEVASLIHANPEEIIWTSGATESINLALKGAAHFYGRQGKHVVTSAIEHKAGLAVCDALAREGYEITYLKPAVNGLLDLDAFKAALRPDTLLASIMWVNNEIGVVENIQALSAAAQAQGVLFHADAVQAVGKVTIDARWVDFLSLSAHKFYGPKGVGALYVRSQPRRRLVPLFHGGGHQSGLRPGTLPTHQIVGMGEAAKLARENFHDEVARIRTLSQALWHGIADLPGVTLNGDAMQRVPHNLNVRFADIDGEVLMLALKDLAVSSGSACNSAAPEPSHVLTALGQTRLQATEAIRLSLGRFTTEEEVTLAVSQIREVVTRLRAMMPVR